MCIYFIYMVLLFLLREQFKFNATYYTKPAHGHLSIVVSAEKNVGE